MKCSRRCPRRGSYGCSHRCSRRCSCRGSCRGSCRCSHRSHKCSHRGSRRCSHWYLYKCRYRLGTKCLCRFSAKFHIIHAKRLCKVPVQRIWLGSLAKMPAKMPVYRGSPEFFARCHPAGAPKTGALKRPGVAGQKGNKSRQATVSYSFFSRRPDFPLSTF